MVGFSMYYFNRALFTQRLNEHRSKFGSNNVFAAAANVEGGKSEAQRIETISIRRMVASGFQMESIMDASHLLR